MKLTLFIDTLQVGGTQRQIVVLAESLAEQAIDVELLTIFPGGRFWQDAQRRHGIALRSLYGAKSASKAKRVAGFIFGPMKLRRHLQEHPPDVLYSMLDVANLTARLATFGLARRPRLVWGIRASARQASVRATIVLRLCKRLVAGVPLVIANSHKGIEAHREMGFRIRDSEVVHNGFDTNAFRFDGEGRASVRNAWHVDDDEIVIGLIGRVDPMKGHDTFIMAAATLADAVPRLRFVCVGPGQAAMRERLEGLPEAASIRERLQFVDGSNDMSPVYSAIDVVAMASHAEGFPNVVGEAMACGRACVATDVGDTAELLGDCGVLVPPGNPRALADGIERAIQSCDELGACGRSRIEREFTPAIMAERTRAALERVLSA